MTPRKLPNGRYRVRYYEAGRESPRRSRTFDRREDAVRFETEVKRRLQLGELAESDWSKRTVKDLCEDWFEHHALPNLAPRTLKDYTRLLDLHIVPRLGGLRLRSVRAETIDRFRAELRRAGVGERQAGQTLTLLQGIFTYAESRDRVSRNPVRAVPKPKRRRQKAIAALAPSQVEGIRARMLVDERLGDAALVSVLAYAGLRPQEALALEWRHVRKRTLLVEQKNTDGTIVAGQKAGHPPRTIPLIAPLVSDLAEWRLALGTAHELVFPDYQGQPWPEHSWLNWNRRVWTPARKAEGLSGPPYSLRHSYASLRLREQVPITELAQELGHSPEMTLRTYAHVIEELKGEPSMSAEDQVREARRERGRRAA